MDRFCRSSHLNLDNLQGPMRLWRKFEGNGIARKDLAPDHDDTHYSSLPNETTVDVPDQARGHHSGPKLVDLGARIPKAGKFDHRRLTHPQTRPNRKPQKFQTARRDVLAHRPRPNLEALAIQFVKKL